MQPVSKPSHYQVIARKFRPQSFKDVVGQEAVVTTLKNAIKFNRLAQAYLFCGSRGTGKTTLARLLAKALNCQQPLPNNEPCNQCSSCSEITSGSSLEVLEIDGASHRGIEDIRQINETVAYAAASGGYKIYIIDEVHMLTKEAFNALLKTLEEPPPRVKFFFATTEPHKIPPTILSRCQRFNLNRISLRQIVDKLRFIAQQLDVKAEESALLILAQRAEGGLRDAESLFDQIIAFEEGPVTVSSVAEALGLMPREVYFEIDLAGKEGNLAKAFEISHRIFSEGKELTYFIEGLVDHLRQIILIKISSPHSTLGYLTESEREKYLHSAQLYSQEQCMDLIEYLLDAQNRFRLASFTQITLETILLHVMRSHFRLSIDQLVRHLGELEERVNEKQEITSPAPTQKALPASSSENIREKQQIPAPIPAQKVPAASPETPLPEKQKPSFTELSLPAPALVKPQEQPLPAPKATPPLKEPLFGSFISEDPTPSPSDLGKKAPRLPSPPLPQPPPQEKVATTPGANKRPVHEYDTLLHFAAVELEGRLEKKRI